MAGRGTDEGRRKPPGSAPGSTAPGTEKPQWSAERRASVATEAARLARRVGRLRQPPRGSRKPPRFSALRSPHGALIEITARPAPQRIRAMTLGCLKLESKMREQLR